MSLIFPESIFNPSQARFAFRQDQNIKQLPGFKKTIKVPPFSSQAASRFLGTMVDESLRSNFQSIHRLLRQNFGLRRKQVEITIEEGGTAVLESNLFRLVHQYSLLDPTAETILQEVCLDLVDDLNILAKPIFTDDFPYRFSTLEFDTPAPLDVESLIDFMESSLSDSHSLQLDYNFEATRCELSLDERTSTLAFTPDLLTLEIDLPKAPPYLVQEFAMYQDALREFVPEK